ncbi:MAG: hypothetical protein AAB212_10785 [Bacteroidota bacterium]
MRLLTLTPNLFYYSGISSLIIRTTFLMGLLSAIGAALVIHGHWNRQPVPGKMIQLKRYI